MAHLMTVIRGVKHAVDLFITQCQGKFLKMDVIHTKKCKCKICKASGNLNKKWTDNTHIALSVRPIQLVEFAFPKDSKDLVFNTVLNPDWNGKDALYPKHYNLFFKILRKLLGKGWKKIPKYKGGKDALHMPINMGGVQITGLAYKDDRKIKGELKEYEGI